MYSWGFTFHFLPTSFPLYLAFTPYSHLYPCIPPSLFFTLPLLNYFSPPSLSIILITTFPSHSLYPPPSISLSIPPSLPLYLPIPIYLPTSLSLRSRSQLYISPLSIYFPPSPHLSLPSYPSLNLHELLYHFLLFLPHLSISLLFRSLNPCIHLPPLSLTQTFSLFSLPPLLS